METMFVFDNLDFLWTLGTGAILTIAFVLFLFHKIKKQSPLKAPTGILMIIEMYVTGFHNLFLNIMDGKLKGVIPYFFALFNYIFILSILPLFGFPSLPSNIIFTATISLITFMGIFAVGIFTNGLWRFLSTKYANPIELFSQFAPFISLSVRLFAATLASEFIGEIMIIVLNSMLEGAPWLEAWPLMSAFWSWGWSFVSVFLALIQTFVFVSLTAIYWSQEYGFGFNRQDRIEHYKEEKRQKQLSKKEKSKN